MKLFTKGKSRDKILSEIVKIEKEWFVNVKASNTQCQDNIESFESMRKMFFYPLSEKTLKSYLKHIKKQYKFGKNLMYEKYAIMNGQLISNNKSQYIGKITEIEKRWLTEAMSIYPALFNGQSIDYFENYLKSELKTYSADSLKSYYKDLVSAKRKKRNFALERQKYLADFLGYGSVEAMNQRFSK